MLQHDYASFVSDKLRTRSIEHYQSCSGLRLSAYSAADLVDSPTPFAHLRSWANGREPDFSNSREWVRYYFRFDASSGDVRFKGDELPARQEQELLRDALADIPLCAPSQTLVWPSLDVAGDAEAKQPGAGGEAGDRGDSSAPVMAADGADLDNAQADGYVPSWGVLLETDALGGISRAFGFAISQPLLAEHLMADLLSPQSECACSLLLPESLSEIEDIGTAASVVVRDGAGRMALSSGPIPEGLSPDSLVRSPLGDGLPFPGWTVEVAIRPQVMEELLPSGGLPMWALVLLGTVVAGAALLGARSLRRSEELLRLQENFVSNVSHELKTPLSKIRLFNELLDPRRGEPEKASRYRGVIDRECRRLSLLVDNVLRFSEPGSGTPSKRLRRISMNEVAGRALETFRAANDPQRERFLLKCLGDGVVHGDEPLLQQVLMNLLDNAVKYSPAGSPIVLRVQEDAGRVRVEVEDRGPGVPSDQRQRIFEEFYRIEGDDDQCAAGSGLGLALVRRHVEAHGGRVSVRPAPDGGSIFSVELPAVAAKSASSADTAPPTSSSAFAQSSQSSPDSLTSGSKRDGSPKPGGAPPEGSSDDLTPSRSSA